MFPVGSPAVLPIVIVCVAAPALPIDNASAMPIAPAATNPAIALSLTGITLPLHDREVQLRGRALARRVGGRNDQRVAPERKPRVLRQPPLETQPMSTSLDR